MIEPETVAQTLPVRVAAVTREAEDVLSFELVSEGGDLPPFEAGAHVDVRLVSGTRQYSLCNDPAERHRYLIAVLREPAGRGGSRELHEMKLGASLTISAPKNHFPLAGPEARSHRLLAGGIGITPMMTMAETLRRRGAEFHLDYCVRSPDRAAFLDRLAPLVSEGRATIHYDQGDPSRGLDIAAALREYRPGEHLYYCGPKGFMSAVRAAVGAWPSHAVHCEYFTAAEVEEARTDTAFQVTISGTGTTFDVPPAKSIVDVLRENGFDIDTDCREGYCGTCITRYVAGEPEHRDTVLSERERKSYVMICCARAKSSSITLDL